MTSPKINYKKAMIMEADRHKELLERRRQQMDNWKEEESFKETEAGAEAKS